jgi:hypothetical protein
MSFSRIRALALAAFGTGTLFLSGNGFGSDPPALTGRGTAEGYTCVIRYGDTFLAGGSDGRIDRFSSSGVVTGSVRNPGVQVNSLLVFQERIMAAGNRGSLLVSSDGETFSTMDSKTKENINALAELNGKWMAAADHGQLLIGNENGVEGIWQLDLKGNIVGLSARIADCYGVTDAGEIIHTTNGTEWTVFDFNREYAGFYASCRFTGVTAADSRIAVAGEQADGSPAVFFSARGQVWTQAVLQYEDNQGRDGYLTEVPRALYYDRPQDRFVLACGKGTLLTLPSCSHCNRLILLPAAGLEGIAGNEHTLVIVGEDFCMETITTK